MLDYDKAPPGTAEPDISAAAVTVRFLDIQNAGNQSFYAQFSLLLVNSDFFKKKIKIKKNEKRKKIKKKKKGKRKKRKIINSVYNDRIPSLPPSHAQGSPDPDPDPDNSSLSN